MMRVLLLVALAPTATAVGWSQFRGGPYRDGGTTTTVGPKANNLLWRFLLRGTSQGAPTVHPDESMVYVGGTDGFYGVNSDGTFGWYLRIDKGVVNSALPSRRAQPSGVRRHERRHLRRRRETGLTKWTVWTKGQTTGKDTNPTYIRRRLFQTTTLRSSAPPTAYMRWN